MADDQELNYYIKFFAKSHCDLIDAEREEEKREVKYDPSKPEVGILEKKGVLLNNLIINNVRSEYGSCIVEFRKSSAGIVIYNTTAISAGDIANVWYHNAEKENKKTYLASGTIISLGDIIKMSFDNNNPFNWDYEKYFIVKAQSDVTFSRMKNALKHIVNHVNGRCAMIIKHLFGFTKLEQCALNTQFLDDSGGLKFYNSNLHSTQKEAVKFCLEQKNFAIVHGPPGTGKTTVLIEVILQLVNTGHKVLVCAPSNIAVDTLVERLTVIKSKIIRVGKIARMMESTKSFSLGAAMAGSDDAPILKDVKEEMEQHQKALEWAKPGARPKLRHEIRELKKEYYRRQYTALQDLLKRANVVLATLISASDDGDLTTLAYDHFDVVIIDECSQAIEAACWIAIPRASKLIIAGDHFQLPPTIKSKKALDCGLGVSLMERAILRLGPACFKLLTHQFRMNSSIMQWVSTFYSMKLVADTSIANQLLKDLPNVKKTELTEIPLLVVDTAGFDQEEKELNGSKCNEYESEIVALIVKRLTDAGVRENDVSVISPYTLQVSCIKAKLINYPGVEIRTVDGFQGREKEAVIISLVRSNKKNELGFLTDKRRLNVAVSRAQRFLAVIGDSSTVATDDTISSLLTHIEEKGVVYSAHQLSEDIEALNLPSFLSPEVVPGKKKSRSKMPKKEKKLAGNTAWPTSKKCSTSNHFDSRIMEFQAKDLNISTGKKGQKIENKDINKSIESTGSKDKDQRILDKDLELINPQVDETARNPFKSEMLNVKKEKKTSRKKQAQLPEEKGLKELKLDGSDDSDDCDEDLQAIEESKRRNSTCFMKSCKASVKLFPQLCQHCLEVFCISHILPEVHGCGEAARRAARRNFRCSRVPAVQEREKIAASQKLKEKVAQLAAERKRQTKK